MIASAAQRRQFGTRLRQLRLERGFTLEAVRSALSDRGHAYSVQAIGGWERGEYAPKTRTVVDSLEEILDAPNTLAPTLGLGPIPTAGDADDLYQRETLRQASRARIDWSSSGGASALDRLRSEHPERWAQLEDLASAILDDMAREG